MNARVIEAIRRAEIFNDLDDQQLLRVSEVCQAVRVAASTTVFKEGDYGDKSMAQGTNKYHANPYGRIACHCSREPPDRASEPPYAARCDLWPTCTPDDAS